MTRGYKPQHMGTTSKWDEKIIGTFFTSLNVRSLKFNH